MNTVFHKTNTKSLCRGYKRTPAHLEPSDQLNAEPWQKPKVYANASDRYLSEIMTIQGLPVVWKQPGGRRNTGGTTMNRSREDFFTLAAAKCDIQNSN